MHPYYRHTGPTGLRVIRNHSDTGWVDLRYVHLPTYGEGYTVEEAVRRFDARTSEFVRAGTGDPAAIAVGPSDAPPKLAYGGTPSLLSQNEDGPGPFPSTLCLAALAYLEFFPWDRSVEAAPVDDHLSLKDRLSLPNRLSLKNRVSEAILQAVPQWCGSFGSPSSSQGVEDSVGALLGLVGLGGPVSIAADEIAAVTGAGEGNYDLTQMPLIVLAYRYYDQLTPAARKQLVEVLLAQGGIYRPNIDLRNTSGAAPQDWALAGEIRGLGAVVRIGETENHILQIHTARYLTNQLLYMPPGPDYDPDRDNRRNGIDGGPSCTELMLILLQNFLMDDFSEYNAKSYQSETRNALRNLCSYAYDHEVRVAARMVMDYLSTRVAVSSCDLRRMLPFRRRNEGEKVANLHGVMDVGLLEWRSGADRAVEPFVVLTGNTRAFETCPLLPNRLPPISSPPGDGFKLGPVSNPGWYRVAPWTIQGSGEDGLLEGLGDYRLPPLIHDLFVNDLHRQYMQYLHRTQTGDSDRTGQNADNFEIYAGSPSYLITAGGSPDGPAVGSDKLGTAFEPRSKLYSQLGVAVTTSFMPTGQSAGHNTQNYAADLIQFGSFTQHLFNTTGTATNANYGVAPDFACGDSIYLPSWSKRKSPSDPNYDPRSEPEQKHDARSLNDYGSFTFLNRKNTDGIGPGFYLAIYQDDNGFAAMEAYDTWLDPHLDFDQFACKVYERNKYVDLRTSPSHWTMTRGSQVDFTIYRAAGVAGATISTEEYSLHRHQGFLSGTVLNSTGDGVITISNPGTKQSMVLDMSDKWHPVRTSETGEVELGGGNTEVWVNFDYSGPQSGDFFQPFSTVSAALAAVAEYGVIKILPGYSTERVAWGGKSVRIEAAIGGVVIGTYAPPPSPTSSTAGPDPIRHRGQ